LLLALLWERGQGVSYVPGLSVDRARDGYRGESKTDRKDARVIADQARMRADLGRLEPGDEALAELQLLLARRRDLVADRTRAVTRLRETLLALLPALERAFNFNTRGPLELVASYQSAGAIRRAGRRRIAAYLKKRGVAKADALAEKAVADRIWQ
jgi:transposase